MIEQFLKQLTTVASSPYAFVAYVALVIVWAIVVVKSRRLVAISQNLSLLPEADRKSILEKDYGFHLKEGMSAKDFLKAQRTAYVFYAFVAVVLTALIISVLAILRAKTNPVDLRRTAFQDAVHRIISSIDNDFTSIKGRSSREDTDDETDVFESTVLLPGSVYNYIEFDHDDVPVFLASLYHGEDPIVAFNVYHDSIQELRIIASDWIPHASFMDLQEPQVADEEAKPQREYVSFVKGDKKIIVSLSPTEKASRQWHIMVMFKKVSNKPDT